MLKFILAISLSRVDVVLRRFLEPLQLRMTFGVNYFPLTILGNFRGTIPLPSSTAMI
jgi:hypothetical protein